jgi:hypothetical protein
MRNVIALVCLLMTSDVIHKGLRSVCRLVVFVTVVPSSPILVTLMMEVTGSSETPALTTATRLNIPEDGILHSYRRGNIKSYKTKNHWVSDWNTPSLEPLNSTQRTNYYLPNRVALTTPLISSSEICPIGTPISSSNTSKRNLESRHVEPNCSG